MGRALSDAVQPYDRDINQTITWAQAAEYKFASKSFTNYTKMQCITPEIGSNPNPFYHKQCFCEPTPRKTPRLCAKENGTCECNGVAFFGVEKDEKTGKVLSFEETLDSNYIWINSTTETKCDVNTFGFDPKANKRKQCYCDDVNYIDR